MTATEEKQLLRDIRLCLKALDTANSEFRMLQKNRFVIDPSVLEETQKNILEITTRLLRLNAKFA